MLNVIVFGFILCYYLYELLYSILLIIKKEHTMDPKFLYICYTFSKKTIYGHCNSALMPVLTSEMSV